MVLRSIHDGPIFLVIRSFHGAGRRTRHPPLLLFHTCLPTYKLSVTEKGFKIIIHTYASIPFEDKSSTLSESAASNQDFW